MNKITVSTQPTYNKFTKGGCFFREKTCFWNGVRTRRHPHFLYDRCKG